MRQDKDLYAAQFNGLKSVFVQHQQVSQFLYLPQRNIKQYANSVTQ